MRDFAFAVSRSNSVRDLIEQTLATALPVLGAASASLSRLEPEQGRVRILHNMGDLATWELPWPEQSYYALDEYAQLLTTVGGHQPCWTGSVDDPSTTAADRDLIARLGKRHAASFQVLIADRIWGDLYVTRGDGASFGDADCAAGLVLVGLLSAGLSRLELLTELSSLAYTDPLTQLANRRAADDWLERRLSAPEPFPAVSVVLCDINGLKSVNDAFGHGAGDELVRLAAEEVAGAAGDLENVLAARIGGDEFVLLVDGADQPQVEVAVRRLADAKLPHGLTLAVGASSVVRRPAMSESTNSAARALMRLADAAQYQHKRTRVLVGEALVTSASSVAVLLPERASGVADRALTQLAAEPDLSPVRRLAIVGEEIGQAFDANSWWVSRARDNVLIDVLGRQLRPDPRGGLEKMQLLTGHAFDPRDYPATLAALGGGSFYASLTEGEPTERALLASSGYFSVLCAGETGRDGAGWLLEVYGDPQTSSGLFAAEDCLRALVHVAIRWSQ